ITDKTETRVNPSLPFNDWTGTSGPSDIIGVNAYAYDWRTFITASYSQGPWSATLRWRHLPSISSQAAGTPGNTDRDTKPYDVFNLSGRYNVTESINLRFGIDNLLDEAPERAFAND